ncbi:hypothetical protein WHR41_01142 [Cladosporium halotolerans]|uniref:Heat shock factor binding protein 1 n=1 Tax=Cladosporium halotolerans TaxID=1052096 RepID=A0AB34L2I4_9PEZI
MASDSTATLSAQVNRLSISGTPSPSSETQPSDLVSVVDDLLNQLNSKFSTMSSDLIAKMDEMSQRLDSLEATIQASNAQNDSDAEKQ